MYSACLYCLYFYVIIKFLSHHGSFTTTRCNGSEFWYAAVHWVGFYHGLIFLLQWEGEPLEQVSEEQEEL